MRFDNELQIYKQTLFEPACRQKCVLILITSLILGEVEYKKRGGGRGAENHYIYYYYYYGLNIKCSYSEGSQVVPVRSSF